MVEQVIAWGHTELTFEKIRKMALCTEAGHIGDFTYGVFAGKEQLGGAVEAANTQQVVGSNPCKGFDFPIDVRARESEFASELVYIQLRIAYIFVDIRI